MTNRLSEIMGKIVAGKEGGGEVKAVIGKGGFEM